MKKLIMKCADERKRAFAMITSVWEDEGRRFVEKCAVHKEGRRHLENIMRYRTLLDEIYPGVRVCPAKLTESGLVFDYIEGSSLEDRYRLAASQGDRDALTLYMKNHAELLDSVSGSTIPFEETESFREWFGDGSDYEEKPAYRAANFDATASNIILQEGEPVFIDYEWVTEFPVPRDLVVYHAIRDSYYHIPELESLLPLAEAMTLVGVETEQEILQRSYEHFFFSYVYGSDSDAGLSVLTDRKKIEYLANERTVLAERMWKENERAVLVQRSEIDRLTRELEEARKKYADLDQSWFWRWDETRGALQKFREENAALRESLRLMEQDRDTWKSNFETVTNSRSYKDMMKLKGILGRK